MTAEDAPGAVTICKHGRTGLYADDLGVSVRRSYSRGARFAWAEIDRFADGSKYLTDGGDCWVLVIVLRTGRRVSVDCTLGFGEAAPETLAAIRQVADCHEIPAELTGVPMTDDGRPVSCGLHADPGGRADLRYWDGTQWSPLLPLGLKKAGWGWDQTNGKSAGFWSGFPVADGRWDYAAVRARRLAVWLACFAAVTAALLTTGLVIWLWWDHGSSHRYIDPLGWFAAAMCVVAAAIIVPWRAWMFYRKLDKASRSSVDRLVIIAVAS